MPAVPRRRRHRARLVVAAAAAFAVTLMPASALPGSAFFNDVRALGGNAFGTDTMLPPTSLAAAGDGAGHAVLTWTPTASSYADGYKVYRAASSGGPWTTVSTVTGAASTTWTDMTPPAGTSYYVLRSYKYNWDSGNTTVSQATPIATVADTFSGTNGTALGITETGGRTWLFPNGATWTRTSGNAQTSTSIGSNPMAVVDVARADADVTVTAGSYGGGEAIYARVSDASNWLRARVNMTETSSTYTYYNTEYQWTSYSTENEYADAHIEYEAHNLEWNPWQASGGTYCASSSHYTTSPGATSSTKSDDLGTTGCSGGKHKWQDYTRTTYESSPPYLWTTCNCISKPPNQLTGNTRIVDDGTRYWGTSPKDGDDFATGNTRSVASGTYWSSSYCSGCPTRQVGPYTGTSYTDTYYLVLDKNVAGSVSTLGTWTLSGAPSSLRLTLTGSTLSCYTNGSSTALGTVTEPFNQAATRHGIGIGGPTYSTPTGINSFSMTYNT